MSGPSTRDADMAGGCVCVWEERFNGGSGGEFIVETIPGCPVHAPGLVGKPRPHAPTPASEWVVALLHRHGVRVHRMGPKEIGLLGVPAKWAGVIGDLATALQEVAAGRPLPTFAEKKRSNP